MNRIQYDTKLYQLYHIENRETNYILYLQIVLLLFFFTLDNNRPLESWIRRIYIRVEEMLHRSGRLTEKGIR